MPNQKIRLTEKNLLTYGEIVLVRSWKNKEGSEITERYVIWDTDKMNGVLKEEFCNPNRRRMYLLTMVNGQYVTMKQV